jgi:hypothetical protein
MGTGHAFDQGDFNARRSSDGCFYSGCSRNGNRNSISPRKGNTYPARPAYEDVNGFP